MDARIFVEGSASIFSWNTHLSAYITGGELGHRKIYLEKKNSVGWLAAFWQPNAITHDYNYRYYLFIVFVRLAIA